MDYEFAYNYGPPPDSLHGLFDSRNPQGFAEYKASLQHLLTRTTGKLKSFLKTYNSFKETYERYYPEVPCCIRKNLAHRLQEDLLPLLHDNIVSLCTIFDRSSSENRDLTTIFRATLESMSQVDKVLIQIMSSIASVWSPPDGHRPYDGNLAKNFEDFEYLLSPPWNHFRSRFCLLVQELAQELDSFGSFLTNVNSLSDLQDDEDSMIDKTGAIENVLSVTDTIDNVMKFLNQSDFLLYKRRWRTQVKALSTELVRLNEIIHRAKTLQDPKNVGWMRLLNASVPIIKLARLFLNKIAKRTNSHFHPVSQMNAAQQNMLSDSTEAIRKKVQNFVTKVTETPAAAPNHTSHILVNDVMDSFATPILILDSFFRSVSHSHRPEIRETHDWCLVWSAQFDVAVKEFLMLYINQYHGDFPRMFIDGHFSH